MVTDGDGRHVAFWLSNVDRQNFKRKLSAESLGTFAKTPHPVDHLMVKHSGYNQSQWLLIADHNQQYMLKQLPGDGLIDILLIFPSIEKWLVDVGRLTAIFWMGITNQKTY